MLFKFLHKNNYEDEDGEVDVPVTGTNDEISKTDNFVSKIKQKFKNTKAKSDVITEVQLESSLHKKIIVSNRKQKIKNIVLGFLLFLGIFGGYKSLVNSTESINVATSSQDNQFVVQYTKNYFTFPKNEELTDYLSEFTRDVAWSYSVESNEIKESHISDASVYKVITIDDENTEFYIQANQSNTYADGRIEVKEICLKVSVLKTEEGYLVTKPMQFVKSQVNPISKEAKKEIDFKITTGNEECTPEEKAEIENSIKLFLTAYSTDFEQAKLLVSMPLDAQDASTVNEITSVSQVTKSGSIIYIEVAVRQTTNTYFIHNKKMHFEFNKDTNKIIKMEEY